MINQKLPLRKLIVSQNIS